MKKHAFRFVALLLVAVMLLGITPFDPDKSAFSLNGITASAAQKEPDENGELSREEMENVVSVLDGTVDSSKLTDDELSKLTASLLGKLEENKTPSFGKVEESIYDENGAITVPFDVAYPELVEAGGVAYDDGSLLVKMPADATLSAALTEAGVVSMEKIVPMGNVAWFEVTLSENISAKAALAKLRDIDEVLLAEFNYEVKTAAIDDYKHFDDKTDKEFQKNGHNKDQWHFHHCGIPDGYQEMENAGGSSSVVVAVIDTGVDFDHEDLKDNIWVNTAEIPGNGIDDDKNGYVDDYYGVDVIAGKGNGDDDNGHGTHVAGIIAADNNNTGVVGIAYNVKIMPIKAAMHNGTLNQADIAEAVYYAYEMGAEVINMSFGGAACTIAVQDALATAYTRCVLVASAGNNGLPNEMPLKAQDYLPNYPAALSYVLGVMSVDENGVESSFSNWDVEAFNGVEYELYAPGEEIMSTLPDDRYGILSGTSMAAPMVSAMAAILRSEFSDRDMYPTKFIYGQLSSTSEIYADCLDPESHGLHNLPQIVDLNAALTKLPKPELGLNDFAIFDSPSLSEKNNGDGVIDAGETIALGLTLRNRWGMSENTLVTIDTLENGISDPYVTILNPTVNYGSVGTYSTGDCGKIYTDGLLTGFENPFLIQIADDCPNDYRLTFHVTIRCGNALDEEDKTEYVFGEYPDLINVNLNVRNGVVLPAIIDEDMILTPDNLYIIPNSTVIRQGATVRVQPGTHIQFWSDDANDPYADSYMAYLRVEGVFLAEGTRENPVYIYPSQLMDMYNVEIGSTSTGYISLVWADVTNLYYGSSQASGLSNAIDFVDHCTFRQNYGNYHCYRYLSGGIVIRSTTSGPNIAKFGLCQNSVFYKQGSVSGYSYVSGEFARCLFVDCGIKYSYSSASTYENCVFLGNNFVDQTKPNIVSTSSLTVSSVSSMLESHVKIHYKEETATTYIVFEAITKQCLEYLKAIGLNKPLIIETQEEFQWLKDQKIYTILDTFYDFNLKKHLWSDGSEIGTFMDPNNVAETAGPSKAIALSYNKGIVSSSGTPSAFEIPGKILPNSITFNEYEVMLDLEGSYQISPINTPIQLFADSFLYESKDESVVKVDQNGLVTPVGLGKTDVYVYSEDKAVYNYISFEVKETVSLQGISLEKASAELAVGETLVLPAILTPSNTTKRNVVYTSSDSAVFTVKDGILLGVGSGKATLTATCEGMSATCEVTVYQKATSLMFDRLALVGELSKGTAALPKVIASEGAETILSWRSTDEEVATIENGALTLKKLGTTTIVVEDERSGLSTSCFVSVQNKENKTIKKMDVYQSYATKFLFMEDGSLYYNRNSANFDLVLENVVDFSYSPRYSRLVILCADGTVTHYHFSDTTGKVYSVYETFKLDLPDGIRPVSLKSSFDANVVSYHVLLNNGNVYAWGNNKSGQLGVGTTISVTEPTLVNLDNVVEVVTSNYNTLFLTADGSLYLCGQYNGATTPQKIDSNVARILYLSSSSGSSQLAVWLNRDGSLEDIDGSTRFFPLLFDFVSYGYSHVNPSGEYGIGIASGVPYALDPYADTATKIPGITNAIYSFSTGKTHYIVTADGMLFGYGENNLSYNSFLGAATEKTVTEPVLIPLEKVEEEISVLSAAQEDDSFRICFNKALMNVSPRLYRGDLQITVQTEITDANHLKISRASGFEDGVEYTLVFPAGSISAAGGVTNAEEITLTFTYDASLATPDAPATPDASDAPVIHESVLDESIERILTPARLVADYNEWMDTYQINDSFVGNAILNHFTTDTEVTHWLRPLAPSTSGVDVPLGGNWWGTTNEKAIELQMIDYRDFATYGLFQYAPYLTQAPEDTFPFIVDLSIYNKNGEKVTTVGNETITVRITFNRDMDTTVPLQVRFGSAYPYGDYEIEGKYVSARVWEGTYTLTTVIENGNQLFTVSNGRSATDDLEFYTDRGRFGFVIDTTAAQALIMQGYTTDTGIQLSWMQDDFDTLMGYNVYRATKEDGLYTRLNSSVIPATQMTFFDGTVEPGVKYFYNFTVVKTDLTESTPSGKITITSRDTMAPDIYHTPVYNATTGKNLIITATVTDNYHIEYAKVFYRTVGESQWKSLMMQNLNSKFSAIIPASELSTAGIEYYIVAFDGVSETSKGTAANPYTVTVQLAVDTNAMGDVDGNGIIEVRDALMLLQAANDLLNLTPEQFLRADLNGDGELLATEALRILQYVSGKTSSVM